MKGLKAKKFFCVFVIVVGLVSLITCGNDNNITGLGSSVDTSQPEVTILTEFGTGPGTYLTGKERIYIDANDDLGLKSVIVTYSYYYEKDGVLYPMQVTVEAWWSPEDGCYVIDIDTLKGFYDESTDTWLPMVDGTLTAVIIVTDKSGKTTTTPEIIYTVKNGPPKITMQIPKPRTRNSELVNDLDPNTSPIVVSDSYFLGVYEDLAGLAPGYPLIKLWEVNQSEPSNFRQNAGWENVSSYNSPGDGWIRPDEGASESDRGEKGGSFRYYLRNRQSNGNPFAEDTNNGLAPDKFYNLKIRAVDINGIVLEWPRDVYPNRPEYMSIRVDASGVPPAIEILEPNPDQLYFSKDFNIIAKAKHQGDLSTDIAEMRFEVPGKDGKTVLLKQWIDDEIGDDSPRTFPIELGKTYYCTEKNGALQSSVKVNSESEIPGNAVSYVTFTDGNFTFNVTARDDVGAKKTVSFSLYIDHLPPATSVVGVTPYYSQDKAADFKTEDYPNSFKNDYRRWTVNSTVQISVNSTDNRGNAVDSNGYLKFKYRFFKNSDISESAFYAWKGSDSAKTFERYLYEAIDASFIEEVIANPIDMPAGVTKNAHPLINVEGKDGSYTFTLQTHKWDAAAAESPYKLWMYIVAMDNAGNISFDKILLNVDQTTDEPRITYGNISADNSTFMDDKYNIRLDVIDDNGLSDLERKDTPKIKYRFAKNSSEMNSLKDTPDSGWHDVYDWSKTWNNILSEDVKSVTITDLTLKKIACDLLGRPYNASQELDNDLRNALGNETDPKFLQIRAIDNEKTKVYPDTDGYATKITEWRQFTMDLTYPEVHISNNDLSLGNITRASDNPFGIPEKNRAYRTMDYFYGDIIEENLRSISVKIDGDNANTITYTIGSPEPGKDPARYSTIYPQKPAIAPTQFYVWENGNDNGKKVLRWYIPKAGFNSLGDGPHTFEISFEDKVPQVTTRSLTFYKDTKGPTISFVNPGNAGTLTPSELTALNTALNNGTQLNPVQLGIYNALTDKSIKDMSAKLSGTFTDDYSPIAGDDNHSFWWKIDNGSWQEELITISEDKAVSWEVPLTNVKGGDELDDGVHTLSIKVIDSLGNGSETDMTIGGFKNNMAFLIDKSVPELAVTDAPPKPINGAYPFKGKITKTNKIKQFSVKLGNDEIATIDENGVVKYPPVNGKQYGVSITKVDPTPGVGKSFEFTATINPAVGGLEDGPKSLMFSAVGSSGQSGMTTSSFTLDTKGPSIAIGAPLNDSVYLANNTEWIYLKDAVDQDDFSLHGGISTVNGSTYDKVFQARIKDINPQFSVTFTDEASDVFNSTNNTFWYKFDNGSWTPATSTTYGKTSVSVSLSMPSDMRTDGVHRVSIRARDSLGNGYTGSNEDSGVLETGSGVGYQSNLVFMIDTGVPVLTVINDKGETVLGATDFGIHKEPFKISGIVTETFDVQDLNVKVGSTMVAQKTNGGVNNNITWTPKPNGKRTYNFSNVNIDPLLGASVTDGSKDGSYTVSVTVKGSSEQSVMNVSTVTLDTQGPKITINAPIKEKIYLTDAQRTSINTAINANNIDSLTSGGLKTVYYDLLKYNVKDASTGLSGSFADTYLDVGQYYWYSFNGGAWAQGNTIFSNQNNKKSADWKIDLPSTLQDGMNRLSIRVKDSLSNGYGNTSQDDTAINSFTGDAKNSGNGYETNLNFILDTGTPTFNTVTGLKEGNDPDVKGPLDAINVSGRITGTFMVKKLSVSIVGGTTVISTPEDGTPGQPVYGDPYIYDFNLTPVTGTTKAFDYSFKVKNIYSGNELAYGSRSITINAQGSSDNSAVKTLSFIYDNLGPTVNVSVPSDKFYLTPTDKNSLNAALDNGTLTPAQNTEYTKLASMIISDASAKLTGTFTDEYSPVAGNGHNTFWYQLDNDGTWKTGILTPSTNKSVGWEVDISTLPVGVHLLNIRVKDSLGNGKDNGSGPTDDNSGWGYETNIAFMIDKNPPEITQVEVPEDALNGKFTVTGKVINTYGVKKLSVKLGNDEIAVIEGSLGNYTVTPKQVKGVDYTYGSRISITRTSGVGKSFDFTAYIDPKSFRNYTDGLQDGPKSLTFTAIGSSGQAAIGVDSFTLDTTGPSVTVGAPIGDTAYYVADTEWTPLEQAVRQDNFAGVSTSSGSTYDKLFEARIKDNKASFTVTFTDDASNIFTTGKNKYWYRFDGEGWKEATVPDTELNKRSVSVKLPLPTTTLPNTDDRVWTDSVHRLSVRVKDSLDNGYDNNTADSVISALGGNKSNNDNGHETYRTFMIDSGKPTLALTTPNLGTFKATDKISVSGTIEGTFKVQELNAKIGDYSAIITNILPQSANSRKTYKFDNVSITPTTINDAIGNAEGSYTVSLTVKGSSEQSDMKTSTFILDTKGPTISINAPIKDKIYLSAAEIVTINTAINANNTATLTSGGGIGTKFYTLLRNNVKDISAGLSGSFADTYSDIGTQYWYRFNNGAWREENTGVSSASNKKSVDWKINLATQPNGTVTIPNGEVLPEGLNSLSIRVKDALANGYDNTSTGVPSEDGNGYVTNISFILDTGTPVLSPTTGGLSEGTEPTVMGPSSIVTVNGQITGTYMVKRLSVSIGSGADVILTTDGNQAQPTNGDPYINSLNLTPVANTSKAFNYSFNVDVTDTAPAYGSQTITINAIGSSDNSAIKTLSFIYDNKGPNVSVSVPSTKVYMGDTDKNNLNTALNNGTLNSTQEEAYSSLKNSLITDTSTKLGGTFNDEYSPVANNTNKTFWWKIDSGSWTDGTLAVSTSKSVSWEVPISGLLDGVHLLSLRAKDEWGNGYAGDTLPDGNGGQGFENNIAFMIDRSQPTITISPLSLDALNTQFTVSGKIENTYGVKRFSIKLGNDEIAVIDENGNKTYPTVGGITYGSNITLTRGTGKSFNFTADITPVSKKTNPSGQEDGPVSLTFTAIGSSNQVAIGVNNFILDTTGPTIAVGAPINDSVYVADTELTKLKTAVSGDDFSAISTDPESDYDRIFNTRVKDNKASFTVTFTDDKSNIFSANRNAYWYSFDGGSLIKKEVDPSDYGKKSVSVKLPLPASISEGVHSLNIRVMDSLGNGYNATNGASFATIGSVAGSINNLTFLIDSVAPGLTFNIVSPATGTINNSGSLSISGGITKTLGVQELSVKIGSTVVKTLDSINLVTPANKRKEYNFTGVTINSSDIFTATGGNEGSYTISVTAKGSSDQSEMKVSTFILDTTGPTISINSPIKEKIYLSSGQVTDVNTAITNNNYTSLASISYGDGKTLKDKYYDLLKYNVKEVSAGLTGSFADTYSDIAGEYWYSFDGNASWTKGTTSFTNASNHKSADWQIPIAELDLVDGVHRLSIRVKDALSNGYDNNSSGVPDVSGGNGYETNVTFILDTSTPVLSTYGLADNSVIGPMPAHYKVNGTITGTFMVKRLSVAVLPPIATVIETLADGSVPSAVENDDNIKNITLTPAGNKTFDFSFDLYTSLGYGPHSITINAIGSSEQSVIKILPFIFDNKGPAITVNAPITQKIYLDGTELNTIKTTATLPAGELNNKYDQLVAMGIKDASSGLNGYFNDDYSPIAGITAGTTHNTFWYKFLDDETPEWKPVTITITADKSVAWNIPLTNPKNPGDPDNPNYRPDGIYRVSLRVKDSLGNGYDDTTVDSADNSGPGYEKDLAFIIDMGVPQITNFRLKKNDGTLLPDTNIFLNNDFTITGNISNTVSISKLTAKIGSIVITATSDQITKVSDKNFTFAIPVSPAGLHLEQKAHSLSVTATGSSGQSAIEVSNFTYDITPPSASFNSPFVGEKQKEGTLSNGKYSIWWAGSWETGSIKIGGVADDTFGIETIHYHIGKLSNDFLDGTDTTREALYSNAVWQDTSLDTNSPAPKWSGGLYYWNYVEDLNPYRYSSIIEKDVDPDAGNTDSTFYLPFYVKVTDRAGNINVVHYKVYVDPDKDIPSTRIVSPADGVSVGGEIRITGTANDNNWVHSVDIRITDTKTGSYYRNPGDKWVDDVTGLELDEGTGTNTGFVKAKIVGNTDLVVSWYYSINADGKLTPEAGMGDRRVIVEVRAWDTKATYHDIPDLKNKPSMVNYIFDSDVPTISVPVISKTSNDDRSYTDGIRVSGTFKVKAEVKDNGGIASIRARVTGKSDFKEIVTDGVKTSVLAADIGVVGWNVTEPSTVPQTSWQKGWRYYIINPGTISNWSAIDLDTAAGKSYVKGTTIKYNGNSISGSNATAMKADGTRADQSPADDKPDSSNWNSQFFKYNVEFTIDSTKNYNYGKTGIYTLELDVYDNNKEPTPNSTRGTFNMGVDNYYPFTGITTQYNATTATFRVMGTAKDFDEQSGNQQGLERMLVYFSRTNGGVTKYYNARGIEAGAADSFYNTKGYKDDNNNDWSGGVNMVSYPSVRDMTKPVTGNDPNGDMANFPYLKLVGGAWQSPHAMVIDVQEFADTTDTDKDGTYGEMWPITAEKAWQARLDTDVLTTKIGDGPLTVHYIIMDQAGNATHYTKGIYIGNNKPLIRTINLGTDINASGGALTSDEYLANPFNIGDSSAGNAEITTGFRVRNNSFGLKLEALSGNGTKHYRISHVTRKETEVDATSMERGTVYTIATPGDTEWTKYGALYNIQGTTFVATGPAESSKSIGTVYEYAYTSTTTAEKSGDFTGDNANDTFTNFTSMQDTGTKTYDPETGKMVLLHDKLFIVKVYDTTVSGGEEIDQLAHVALLNVDFDNNDGQKPLVTFKPFYWNSLTDNSVYGSDQIESTYTDVKKRESLQGHIELEGDLPASFTTGGTGVNDRDPKVSGKVSFRGTAYDNIVIKNIYFTISNHSNYGITGTTLTGVTGSPYFIAASFNAGSWTLSDYLTNNGWKFAIENESLGQDGHSIDWRLDYDSSFITGVARNDVVLTLVAQDSKATPNTSDLRTKQFDIVPYITKITTRLSAAYKPNPSAFDRSAKGWYPVHEDEVLTINGFNLLSGTDPSVDIRSTNNAASGTSLYTTGVNGGTGTSQSKNTIYARVDSNNNNTDTINTIVSGYLVVKVNSIDSINNINNNDAGDKYNGAVYVQAGYNKEGNGLNNDTLNDDRALYVWNTGYISNVAVANVSHPFMRMNNKSNLVLSYGYYTGNSSGRLRVLRDNKMIEAASSYSNRMFNTTVGVGADNTSWYAAGSDQSSGATQNRGFQLGISTPAGTGSPFRGGNNGKATQSGSLSLVANLADSGSNRFKIPRIAVQTTSSTARSTNNSDRILISYFDDETKEIKVIYGNMGDATAGTLGANTTNNGVTYSTAGTVGTFEEAGFGITSHTADDNTSVTSTQITVATDTDTFNGSMYTAVGFLTNGLPVMAWYDRLNQNLVFSWGGNPTAALTNGYQAATSRVPNAKADWQGNAVIIDSFKGTHVDMAVDGANNVHLAYYDVSNGGLWYALIPVTGTGTAARPDVTKANVTTKVKPVRVDTYLSAGTKLMINVRLENGHYVPYISYAHASFGETKNSIRVAWRTDFNSTTYEGSNDKDSLTGKWEVMTVPVSNTVTPMIDEFVCNGVPTSGTLAAPGGTLRSSSITNSILVGYMTDQWYEGAVLKK